MEKLTKSAIAKVCLEIARAIASVFIIVLSVKARFAAA